MTTAHPRPLLPLSLFVWLFSASALSACAPKAPRIPGPLAAMGRIDGAAVAGISPDMSVDEAIGKPSNRNKRQGEQAIVEAARYYLEHPMRGFRDDCSGYVMAVFARAGRPIDGNTAAFYARADETGTLHHRRQPKPGDIAFFDDTYDRNHNGKLDDALSHVAIVLEVDDDGTMLLAHGGTSRGRTTMQMNLQHPSLRSSEEGAIYNDWLRVQRKSDPAGTRYLSGELWRAFSSPAFAPVRAGNDSVASADKD